MRACTKVAGVATRLSLRQATQITPTVTAIRRRPVVGVTASSLHLPPRWSLHTSARVASSSGSVESSESEPPRDYFVLPPFSPKVQELLQGFTDPIPVNVVWGDQDTFQHVNNVKYIRWVESARIHWFKELGRVKLDGVPQSTMVAGARDFTSGRGVGVILKSVFFNFQSPIFYPDSVIVGTRLHSVGKDRFSLTHRLVSLAQERVVGDSEGIIVCFDYDAQGKADVPDLMRRAFDVCLAKQRDADARAPMIKPPRVTLNYEETISTKGSK